MFNATVLLGRLRGGFRWTARRRALSVIVVGLLSLAGCALVMLIAGEPLPNGDDEFSYLLTADTFASGRLTNPAHQMRDHFETHYVMQEPTYQAKYPPAQGLVLALGQVVFGRLYWGAFLSMAIMCSAICWMLQGWLPPKWALFGGVLAVVQFGMASYWAQSFWGGAVAATGGALVFGGVKRLISTPRIGLSVAMAAGLGVMANSRPFEGLVTAIPVAVVLFVWMCRRSGPAWRVSVTKVLLPMGVSLAIIFAMMGVYHHAVTGSPLRMPYQVCADRVPITPELWVVSIGEEPTEFLNPEFEAAYHTYKTIYYEHRTAAGLSSNSLAKITDLWEFYLNAHWTVPLVMLPWVLRERWARLAAIVISLGACAVLLTRVRHGLPHYAAPVTGLVVYLVVEGMRHLRGLRLRGAPTGAWFIAVIVGMTLLSLLLDLHTAYKLNVDHPWNFRTKWAEGNEYLNTVPGEHLVWVRSPEGWKNSGWPPRWVYNRADVDNSKIVFAREISPDRDRQLMDYYRGRTVWVFIPTGGQGPVRYDTAELVGTEVR